MSRTAFFYHPDLLFHDTGNGHPERSSRLEAIVQHLQAGPLWEQLLHRQPHEAPRDALLRVHSSAHLELVAALDQTDRPVQLSPDTVGSPGSHRAALLAAGAGIAAIDAIFAGEIDNAFCCVRPPGHHAEFEQIMGFCLFNNVAIAAQYLRAECGVSRVAIIDWDVHHGNGTQHSFESDNSVFFFSIHQYPHYPGTGTASERGLGPGQGQTMNIPVHAGSSDTDYLLHFEQDLIPAIDEFKPEFILISAGFDAHRNDPLGQIQLSEEGYRALTLHIRHLADRHCSGRLVSLLEGGYHLTSTALSIEAHLQALLAD